MILRDLRKLVESIDQEIENKKRNAHYKQIGYSTRCKTCNHPLVEDIERLYNNGYSYEAIIEELGLEDISIMALSRHFKNHYPVSQEYKAKQRKLALERIASTMEQYPFLEQYFTSQDDEFIRQFMNDNGFCIDAMKLCPFIRNGMVTTCQRICTLTWEYLQTDLRRAYSSNNKINLVLNAQEDILKCLQCKDQANEERLNMMELFICNSMLNAEVTNKELYANWLSSSMDKQTFAIEMQKAKDELLTTKKHDQ